jgi:hypothetical protein
MKIKKIFSMAFAAVILSLTISATTFAACPVFPNQITQRGTGGYVEGDVSGLAFANYYLQTSLGSGTAPIIGVSAQAFPGFTQGTTKGFTGTGATIGVNWAVRSTAAPGTTRNINLRIYNVLGQTICSSNIFVTVS